MDNFQKNTIRSFRKVKKDIEHLQEQIVKLAENQEKLISLVEKKKKR